MLVEKITSRQNPLVKRFRSLRSGADHHMVLIEGVRMIEEALAAGVHFESIAFTSELDATERGMTLQDRLQHVPCRGALLSAQVMEYISDTETPQGVAAIVTRRHFNLEDIFRIRTPLIVVADGVRDPGNLGTIIRTAEASGATGLIVLPGTTNPFSSKAVRASMGSALRFPVVLAAGAREVITICRAKDVASIASVPATFPAEDIGARPPVPSRPHTEVDFRPGTALIVGGEANGISSELLSHADTLVHIPMAPSVESLNVSTATSVLLYEAARQRGFKFVKAKSKKKAPSPKRV